MNYKSSLKILLSLISIIVGCTLTANDHNETQSEPAYMLSIRFHEFIKTLNSNSYISDESKEKLNDFIAKGINLADNNSRILLLVNSWNRNVRNLLIEKGADPKDYPKLPDYMSIMNVR